MVGFQKLGTLYEMNRSAVVSGKQKLEGARGAPEC